MKILHIIPSYLPAKLASGPIQPTHNLNKELVERGIEVVVYTANLDGREILDVPLNKEVYIDGVKVLYFPITFRSWQYSYGLHRALSVNIKNFDLVHITSVFLAASNLGAYYAKKFGKPYIISTHGTLMKEPLSRGIIKKKIYLSLLENRNLAGAAAIHFLNNKEREDYLAAGFPLKREIVLPNGIVTEDPDVAAGIRNDFKKNFNVAPDKKIILFLGRLHPIKGLDTLIPAFAEVIKKEQAAVLILAGPDENNYRREIELKIENCKLRIGKEVIFAGMLIGEDKIAAYKESDVFVLPSYTEAMSVAVLEAMLFGLPVIATKNVGNASDILKVNAGIVVEKDVHQIADAILKILNNPAMAKKMGESGRQLVEREFSSEKVAERWLEEYGRIISEKEKE